MSNAKSTHGQKMDNLYRLLSDPEVPLQFNHQNPAMLESLISHYERLEEYEKCRVLAGMLPGHQSGKTELLP